MRRRGFTLLEILLAAALGSLVLVAAMGVLFAISRADQALQTRVAASNETARVQRTMQRTFTTLLMATGSIPDEPEAEDDAVDDDDIEDSDDGSLAAVGSRDGDAETDDDEADESDEGEGDDELPPEPADFRLLIASDPREWPSELAMASELPMWTGPWPPQRLTVVLSSEPIPQPLQRDLLAEAEEILEDAEDDDGDEERSLWVDELISLADWDSDDLDGIRGSFMVEPDVPTDTIGQDAGWSLWWVPIEAEPVRVASGIVGLTWAVFIDGEFTREYAASAAEELPAFALTELTFIDGRELSYVYEIGWTVGIEPEPPAAPEGEEGEGDDGDESGDDGGVLDAEAGAELLQQAAGGRE
ncbi:MAG: prepilin-type N-terminal cleavage/methylation domain-containing protein [Planctomycetota bacterium]